MDEIQQGPRDSVLCGSDNAEMARNEKDPLAIVEDPTPEQWNAFREAYLALGVGDQCVLQVSDPEGVANMLRDQDGNFLHAHLMLPPIEELRGFDPPLFTAEQFAAIEKLQAEH